MWRLRYVALGYVETLYVQDLEGVLVEEGVEEGEQEVLDLQGLLGHPVT